MELLKGLSFGLCYLLKQWLRLIDFVLLVMSYLDGRCYYNKANFVMPFFSDSLLSARSGPRPYTDERVSVESKEMMGMDMANVYAVYQ